MKASVCRPGELGPSEVARWHRFQAGSPSLANPFLSPEFAQAVDAVRADARVAVARDGGEIVGFFPFSAGAGRVARPLAAGFNDAQGFVHAPGLVWEVRSLLRGAGLLSWRFDHLVADQVVAVGAGGGRVSPDETFVIDLTGGWDGYRAWALEHRGRYLKWLERKQRRLAGDLPDVTFDYDAHPSSLGALVELKAAQCRRLGWHDLFSDPWRRELLERLAATGSEGCAGTLSLLRSAGRVIAADFSLRSGPSYIGWLIAYDDDVRHTSPGAVRWWYLLRAAAGAGITEVDLGRGADDFKRRFSTTTRPVGVGWAPGGAVLAGAGRVGSRVLGPVRVAMDDERARRAVHRLRRLRYAH